MHKEPNKNTKKNQCILFSRLIQMIANNQLCIYINEKYFTGKHTKQNSPYCNYWHVTSKKKPKHSKCKDPFLLKKHNKASSRVEDVTKSVDLGTHKVGHWSDLSGRQSSICMGKKIVWYYSQIGIVLCALWYNMHEHIAV